MSVQRRRLTVAGQIIRPKELAQRWQCHRATVWRRVKSGELAKPMRLGGPKTRIVGWPIVTIEAFERARS